MKFDVKTCRIISKQKIATDTYDFTLFAGELAQIAQPGQFVHIQVPGKTLRPFPFVMSTKKIIPCALYFKFAEKVRKFFLN